MPARLALGISASSEWLLLAFDQSGNWVIDMSDSEPRKIPHDLYHL